MQPVRDRFIFHFTDHANLAGILAEGGLHGDSRMTARGRAFRECANEGIKGGRRARVVSCPPDGVVADYVPFYYAPRSPMMSSISHAKVSGYTSTQDLIYLVSSLSRVHAAGLRWVCSDGNARATLTDFFNTWADLESVTDWDIMNAQYWADSAEDGGRKNRRSAEFLIHEFFPFALVMEVVAKSERVASLIRPQLSAGLDVKVVPGYYI